MNGYNPLFTKLIEKTVEGKLDWAETASDTTFIAAVKGKMVFCFEPVALPWRTGDQVDAVSLEIKGETGETLVKILSMEPVAKAAYSLAKHGLSTHTAVAEAIQLLESL